MITDSDGMAWTFAADRLTRGPVAHYPGGPQYRLYLRSGEVGAFLRSEARAWFIPVFELATHRIWGNYVIALSSGTERLRIAGWEFSTEHTKQIRAWCRGTPAVQLSLAS